MIATTQGADYATSPFAVVGNQTFIKDAFISKLAVVNGVVGSTLYSQTYTTYGTPRMTINFNAGEMLIRNNATNGKYIQLNEGGLFMVSGAVTVVELVP